LVLGLLYRSSAMERIDRKSRVLGGATALVVAGALLSGCALAGRPQPDPSGSQRQAAERRASDEAARKQAAAYRELEEKVARQHLQLLEKDAEVKALNQKLEAAILEVVRAMAKLRGLSGRAEAASNLAETEIALKSMPVEPTLRPKETDLLQAQQLLSMATEEFKKQNYDGTVYLTSQVKMLIKPRNDRPAKGTELAKTDGEHTLSPVLALRAANRSNVRESPGPSSKILFVVERGTPLSGVSYSGVWVRVKTDDGRAGWVHYSLIDQR
jgi:SH3 domain-containing protein